MIDLARPKVAVDYMYLGTGNLPASDSQPGRRACSFKGELALVINQHIE